MSDKVVYRYKDTVNKFKRDVNGLLECIDYTFNQDNTINWRSMINKEYLVPNRDAFKNQKDINIIISKFCCDLLKKWSENEWYNIINVYSDGGFNNLINSAYSILEIIPSPLNKS